MSSPLGSYGTPGPAQVRGEDPGSPGVKVSCGVAVTVTVSPAAVSFAVTTPVQLATCTNTGTLMMASVPTGGSLCTSGGGRSPAIRPNAKSAKPAAVTTGTQRASAM